MTVKENLHALLITFRVIMSTCVIYPTRFITDISTPNILYQLKTERLHKKALLRCIF
jgi:hypothetical protein